MNTSVAHTTTSTQDSAINELIASIRTRKPAAAPTAWDAAGDNPNAIADLVISTMSAKTLSVIRAQREARAIAQ